MITKKNQINLLCFFLINLFWFFFERSNERRVGSNVERRQKKIRKRRTYYKKDKKILYMVKLSTQQPTYRSNKLVKVIIGM